MALEPEFWTALEHLARERSQTLPTLIADVDARRGERALASALRVEALLGRAPT